MITRRDVIVAVVAAGVTCGALAFASQQSAPVILQSAVFDWKSIPAKPTQTGDVRSFFKAPTAKLEELELHVTTLRPGVMSQPPHKHPHEELVIIKKGTVEALIRRTWQRLGHGSALFTPSNPLHAL